MIAWIYSNTLPVIENSTRYTAPPEERRPEKEAEDFLDYQEPEPETETP